MSFFASLVKPLAYLSLPVLVLRTLSTSSPTCRYYVRVFVYVGTLMSVASCSIAIAAGMSIAGRRFDTSFVVARVFYGLVSRLLNVKINVEGAENLTRPAVLMANHQSMLDVLVVGRLMPKQTSIMSKKSLQFTPLGPFMTMAGSIFIDRGNNARAVRSLEAAGALMNRLKLSLWMFPEGTRHSSEKPDMLSLKKGGFHLAIQSGIPIVPIVVENYWRLFRKGVFDEGSFTVRVLPPIPTVGLTPADVNALATRVREQMLETLRDISVKVPSSVLSGLESKPTTSQPTASPSNPTNTATQPPAAPSEPPATSSSPPTHNLLAAEKTLDILAAEKERELELASSMSSASIAESAVSETSSKSSEERSSEGGETEEDEGMVLVGRHGPAA
ncbi:hypothetical protein BDQ12DRAFT_709582 [Crucibulum laeve]|uniref:1-acyl-sn-glycerol-3-phosphate acyltransferase n=1 Tax=Crucibulum laeve TaxID=68775 RepID=A0A5C3MJ41_9AGAR|nr:hypothetical protein BDQ12DRAFT_709582 [Crucibulum laeve]